MALEPININHAAQIQAGIKGRRAGHKFEFDLANQINELQTPVYAKILTSNVFRGDPAATLVTFTNHHLGWSHCDQVEAIALGTLATAEKGKTWLQANGIKVRASKSDVLLILKSKINGTQTVGVSIKQCNSKTPTNAQLFFTTAHSFCNLLQNNGIKVSDYGELALRQFCGDKGYRPQDDPQIMKGRRSDPRRFFWEEISKNGRMELEEIFTEHQDKITRLLLQKAYLDDPFSPTLLMHKTKKLAENPQEFALYSVENLINLSRNYQGFEKKLYSVRKGQYKDLSGVQHEAPRFGIVQMQRGGQKQHPTQLQFNLQAGYFYKI